MKLGMNQPYFFPYLGFYQLIAAVDRFVIYDNLNYIQYGWINRNRFLVVGGEPTYFHALTEESSPNKMIRDIRLSSKTNWRRKLLNTFLLNYKKCPFFAETYDLLESIVRLETNSLSELATRSITQVCRHLGIRTDIVENPLFEELETSLRTGDLATTFPSIQLARPERKVFRVIAVCHLMKAGEFVNASGGQALYDKSDFKANGVDLYFLRSRDEPYQQTTDQYYPGLSITDVLMNCGKEGTIKLLSNYDLV